MRILIACILALLPATSFAAYQNPKVLDLIGQSDGGITALLEFTGDAGEPTVQKKFTVQPGTTKQSFREWVGDTIAELNKLSTIRKIPEIQIGQIVIPLAKTSPAAPAKQVWIDKFERYKSCSSVALSSAAYNTDCAAIKTDLESSYQAGFIN